MKSERPSGGRPEQPDPTSAGQVHLTSTESRILEVLRAQPGRVFSRSELIALVMPETVVLERTIDVHIKALRQKIGSLGRQIETVRKAGYRFVAGPQRIEGSPG